MAEQVKNSDPGQLANSGASKRSTQGASDPSPERNGLRSGAPAILPRRKRQYVVAVRPVAGSAVSPTDAIHDSLQKIEGVEILRRISTRGFRGLGAGVALAGQGIQDVLVVRMDDQRAEALRQSAPPQVVIEEDARLDSGPSICPASFALPWSNRMPSAPRLRREVKIQVLGEGDQPLVGAGVTILGQNSGAVAVTDQTGTASVGLFDVDAELDDIDAIYVQPMANHWDCFVQRPALKPSETNIVRLRPLSPAVGADATRSMAVKRTTWAQHLMGLDQLGAGLTGLGVKIGLIDSGCDNRHPMLRHVVKGVDLTGSNGTNGWSTDEIGQGTHCAGIIAGNGSPENGSWGIAPEAELHVFKVAPHGRFSNLVEALDYCIERQIDIVHLGVGANQASEIVARKIIEARHNGIACIAASGDDGGPAIFPGIVPGVLCVSAVGRLGEFTADTHHAWTAIPELIGSTGIFATNFSGSGPQIGVCAPGVAVISSAPGGGFAARDGTAIAAAHVVGFAALVFAHHPLFRGAFASRSQQRVNALFDLIQGSATRPAFDPARVGAGLPNFRHVAGMGAPDIDAWNKTVQDLGVIGGVPEGYGGERFAGAGAPPSSADLSGVMALMQMRAVGLLH